MLTQRLRKLQTISEPQRPYITLNGKRVLDFSSNDYLGLSQHPALIEATQKATAQYGTGTGGSRLIGGTLDLHTQLEEKIAQFKGAEKALVFNSGYQANIGVLAGLIKKTDHIFADRLNHASLVDGAILSRATVHRYRHLDMDHLEALLQHTPRKKWIVTDTVFSMDGDLAPLRKLYELADRYEAGLILDEAHATGVFPETAGEAIKIGTFSKALGSFGAYVAAREEIIQTLIQSSRSFIYSTALPPAVIAANLAALELISKDNSAHQTLWQNIRHWGAHSPIIPIVVGEDHAALTLSQNLFEVGFFVHAIRPPTVPEGTARLRLSISACHSSQHLDDLQQILSSRSIISCV